MRGPLFERDGALMIPSAMAVGPWDPGALHGGAAGGLMAWSMEALDPDPEMPFARITCEFLRPVPLAPLRVTTKVTRPGRRVQGVEAEVRAGDELVCRASGLRIRAGDSDVPAGVLLQPQPLPGPETGAPPAWLKSWGEGLIHWMDLRLVRGDVIETGPGAAWFRLGGELVAGETPGPLQPVVTAADCKRG